MIRIEVANLQNRLPLCKQRLREAVRAVLQAERLADARISVALVDDAAMQALNRQYLDHDYPTDVLSFMLEKTNDSIEGEVIVSADTAAMVGPEYGWRAEDELLLYVIHGVLHLVGYRDGTREERSEMRAQEALCLARLGLAPRGDVPKRSAGKRTNASSRRAAKAKR